MVGAGHAIAVGWPLVGRSEELAVVAELLEGEASRVAVAGPAGVGKTRFAREVVTDAAARGCSTVWAAATDAASSIPFGAMVHLLPVLSEDPRGPPGFLQRAAMAMFDQAQGRPLVLAVDDAHLLDTASATLVHELAASGKATVVVTIRTGERVLDSIRALWKDGAGEYLELQSLSENDVANLLAEALGGDVEGATSLLLWKATRGNPLYLRELVRQGVESSALAVQGAVWRWRGTVAPGARLLELIESRIGQLDPVEHDLLALLGVGEPLPVALLEKLAPRGAEDALAALEQAGLLVAQADGRRHEVRFAHPLYGEATRARTPKTRIRQLKKRLGDALEETMIRRRGDVLRLASWRLDAGGDARPELLVSAARHALVGFDPILAGRLATAGTQVGGGLPARLILAESLQQQGKFREAETLLGALTGEASTDEERTMVAEARARNLFWRLGRPDEAEAVIDQVIGVVSDPGLRDMLAVARAELAHFAARPLEALAALGDILDRPGVSEPTAVLAAVATVQSLALIGRGTQAIAVFERWDQAALRVADQYPLAAAMLDAGRVLALLLTGAIAEAQQLAERGYRDALTADTHEGIGAWGMVCGACCLHGGRLASAVRFLRESAARFRELDPVGHLPWTLAFLVQAQAQTGDGPGAEATLNEAEHARTTGMRAFEFELRLGRAWTAAADGAFSAAQAHALEAADAADESGQFGLEVFALHDLCRLGDPATAAVRLGKLVPSLDGALAPRCLEHAQALATRDSSRLERAAMAFASLEINLRAAEAASQASTFYRLDGRLASARAAAARVHFLLERCENAHTPPLAISVSEGLTAREREIATLAATGLSSREIASRLVVSSRTVENHLQHAYQKLGVTGRDELRATLEVPPS
jgi:ATP/maltotriose-dependent transcriptional regulator MalT